MTTNKWEEKRQSVRSSFGWPDALIKVQGTIIHGRVRDLSSGGSLIHIQTKLAINDEIELAINIPDIKDIMSAIGTVVNVVVLDEKAPAPTYAIGVRFTKMTCHSFYKD